ncbi:helix-turn-helix domain-containing protein [Mycobacteroides sp. PCS013]|uniref:helix-turn-helix domain-containing protein n=1 Tax=Mycobacteroides sp. PCS013 TaxID=3074106 RepID=UPI003C2DE8E3
MNDERQPVMTAVMKSNSMAGDVPGSVSVDGPLLVAYLRRSGLSQAALARQVACSRQMIHLLVSGKRSSCTPAMVASIERVLGVATGTLLTTVAGR